MDPPDYLTRDEFVVACGGVWQAMAEVMAWPDLTPTARLVALALLRSDGRNRKRRVGGGTVAVVANVSTRTAETSLRTIKDRGFVKRGDGKNWAWKAPANPAIPAVAACANPANASGLNPANASGATTANPANASGVDESRTRQTLRSNPAIPAREPGKPCHPVEQKNRKNTPLPPKGGNGGGDRYAQDGENGGENGNGKTAAFAAFWKLWPSSPQKGNELAAAGWWASHGLDARAAEITEAVGLLRQSAQWTKDAGQYVPAPLGWLKGERWRDDLSELRRQIAEAGCTHFGSAPPCFVEAKPLTDAEKAEQRELNKRMAADALARVRERDAAAVKSAEDF